MPAAVVRRKTANSNASQNGHKNERRDFYNALNDAVSTCSNKDVSPEKAIAILQGVGSAMGVRPIRIADLRQYDYSATQGNGDMAAATKEKPKKASNSKSNWRKGPPTGVKWADRFARGVFRWCQSNGVTSAVKLSEASGVPLASLYSIMKGERQTAGLHADTLCEFMDMEFTEVVNLGTDPA